MKILKNLKVFFFLLFITITAGAAPSIIIEWRPSSEDCDFLGSKPELTQSWCVNNYRLYWGPSSGNYTNFSDLGHVTNTVFTQLVPGAHYYFVVTAMNSEGAESDPSNEVDFSIPDGNTPPTISVITDKSTPAGIPTAPIPFTVGDVETPAGNLTLVAGSSNPTLVPVSGVSFGGVGANRTIILSPVAGMTGSTTITVTVSDAGGGTVSISFVLTVGPGSSESVPPKVLRGYFSP